MLNLTSQTWLTDADFKETSPVKAVWWHQLTVVVPEVLELINEVSTQGRDAEALQMSVANLHAATATATSFTGAMMTAPVEE